MLKEQVEDSSTQVENESAETTETVEASSEGQAESQPKSLEDALKDVEVEGQGDILSMINSLGLIRNGLPFEYDSPDAIKEHLMKGYDYTQKTQELAEMRKQTESELAELKQSFESERQTFTQEKEQVQEYLLQNDIMAEVLSDLQSMDGGIYADAFDVIRSLFQQKLNFHQKATSNPVVNSMKSELEQLKAQIGQNAKKEEVKKLDDIRQGWESELSKVQTSFAPKLKSLGIKPNWKQVQSAWQADATGKLSVEAALMAIHGAEITKALDAKAKLNETRAKSNLRQGQKPAQAASASNNRVLDPTRELAERFANKYF
jgi:hypothetical protein